MSDVIRVGGIDPDAFWWVGALPLAVALDLALGDVPGRTAAVRWLGRLIAAVEGRVGRLVERLGGGRGGDLFGGLLGATLVVGTAAGLVWIAVDRADAAGGPVSLLVRTLLIAAGLAIRATGDALLQAVEAPDPATAGRWLAQAAGGPIPPVAAAEVAPRTVALTGDLISGRILAPLVWLAVGGPAAFWGFIALGLLGSTPATRVGPRDLRRRVPATLASLAEWPGALLGAGMIALVAAPMRLRPLGALRASLRAGRDRPLEAPRWSRGALAGALGVRVTGERASATARGDADPAVGEATRPADAAVAALGVRVLQLVALLGAGAVMVLDLLRS